MTASWQVGEKYKYETLDFTWVAQSEAAASVIYSLAWSGVARGAEINGAGAAPASSVRHPAPAGCSRTS